MLLLYSVILALGGFLLLLWAQSDDLKRYGYLGFMGFVWIVIGLVGMFFVLF